VGAVILAISSPITVIIGVIAALATAWATNWGGIQDRVKGAWNFIRPILEKIGEERGSLDLSFLGELPLSEAKSWLRELPGVGPKTAGCVLLFSLGRPALPVDTHVFRVAKRLGLIDSRVSAERAHELLEELVPPQDIYSFHLYLIEHGRRICKAQRPRCHLCVLHGLCPSAI